jgi:nitrogen fixation NifU-like protein
MYQEVILDHHKQPRNFREIPDANAVGEGHNPLCGDRVTLYLRLDGDRLVDVAFQGSGCAISKASASLMTDAVKGKTKEEATRLFEKFHDMVTAGPGAHPDTEGLGKLAVLQGVTEFPVRVKCAVLAWHTLKSALEGKAGRVTTE